MASGYRAFSDVTTSTVENILEVAAGGRSGETSGGLSEHIPLSGVPMGLLSSSDQRPITGQLAPAQVFGGVDPRGHAAEVLDAARTLGLVQA